MEVKDTELYFDEGVRECLNNYKEIWRKISENIYSPSIHVTEKNEIGICAEGSIFVKTAEEWWRLALEEWYRLKPNRCVQEEKDVNHQNSDGCALLKDEVDKNLLSESKNMEENKD